MNSFLQYYAQFVTLSKSNPMLAGAVGLWGAGMATDTSAIVYDIAYNKLERDEAELTDQFHQHNFIGDIFPVRTLSNNMTPFEQWVASKIIIRDRVEHVIMGYTCIFCYSNCALQHVEVMYSEGESLSVMIYTLREAGWVRVTSRFVKHQ